MTWYSIRARDVWLFRDGKPFTAGDDNVARSMFPPTPLTVQGALRQKISESYGLGYRAYKSNKSELAQKVSELIGKHTDQKDGVNTGEFSMHGPFVGIVQNHSTMPLLPCPADLLKHEDSHAFKITKPQSTTALTDLDISQLIGVEEGYENLPDYWMTGDVFKQYLNNHPPKEDVVSQDYDTAKDADKAIHAGRQILSSRLIYGTENRFGVSTDSATSFRVEGELYQVQFVSPTRNVCLLVNVTGKHQDSHVEGQMTMGGEQRQAKNSIVDIPDFQNLSLSVDADSNFKIVFLTPAYFKQGWLPKADWSSLLGGDVEMVGAALYRPQRIGGWNNARGGSRPMHNYVAPGSVYYFKAKSAFIPQYTAITESPSNIKDASQIGFGQVAYGTWS